MSLKDSIKEFKVYLGGEPSLLDTHYQRIADMILLHWSYPEFDDYINKLLVVDKSRNRQGFPPEVLEEILALQRIHEKIFPAFKAKTIQII